MPARLDGKLHLCSGILYCVDGVIGLLDHEKWPGKGQLGKGINEG